MKDYEAGIKKGGILMGVKPRSDEDAQYLENEWQSYGSGRSRSLQSRLARLMRHRLASRRATRRVHGGRRPPPATCTNLQDALAKLRSGRQRQSGSDIANIKESIAPI